jgi:predicted GTPase
VGKSSLVNAIPGESGVVDAERGTTRDAVTNLERADAATSH